MLPLFAVAERSTGSNRPLALLRWSLVLIFLRFGPLKFTAAEANGIAPLVEHNPLLSWLPAMLGMQGASDAIGTLETATGLMLAVGAMIPLASALGAAMSCATFVLTLTFLITTPGVNAFVPGGAPLGLFLIKDVVLLAASLCLLLTSVDLRPAPSGRPP